MTVNAAGDASYSPSEPMNAAAVRQPTAAWLAVSAGGHAVLLPLGQCGEIHHSMSLCAVPHTQPWFCGVAALRGELFAVTDLGRWLGLSADAASQKAPVVLLNSELAPGAALRVERMLGLRDRGSLQLATEQPCPPWAQALWLDQEGQPFHELDLSMLAQREDFLDAAVDAATAA